MRDGSSRAATAAVLVVLVAAAAVLRFWALDMGLPNTAARPDEREVLVHTAGFAAGDLNPRWFVYPNLFMYVAWLWGEGYLALRRLWVETPAYATMLRVDLPRMILVSRALSAVAGTATVALVYHVGRAVGGRATGLVAAALLAGNFLHVRDSHAFKTETLLAAGTLAALFLLARWVERPSRGRAVATGLVIGLAAGMKYTALVLLPTVWLAGLLVRPRRLLPPAESVLIVVVAGLTFLATSPFLLLDLGRSRETAALLSLALYVTRPESVTPEGAGPLGAALWWIERRAFGYHVAVSLRHGCGVLFTLATPIALGRALLRRPRPFHLLAAVHCLLHYLVASAAEVHLARYITPLTPILAILVGDLVVAVAAAVQPRLRAAVAAGITAALLAEPIASAVTVNRISAETDTRVLATSWMAEHLPPGAVVAQLGSAVVPIADPELPRGMRRAKLGPGETDLASHGVTYVTLHEHPLPFSQPDRAQLAALAPRLRLLAEFSPWRDGPGGGFEREDAYYVPFYDFDGVVRPGPLVRLYAYEPPLPAAPGASSSP